MKSRAAKIVEFFESDVAQTETPAEVKPEVIVKDDQFFVKEGEMCYQVEEDGEGNMSIVKELTPEEQAALSAPPADANAEVEEEGEESDYLSDEEEEEEEVVSEEDDLTAEEPTEDDMPADANAEVEEEGEEETPVDPDKEKAQDILSKFSELKANYKK